ncbi:tyrosine protein kinase like otk like [Elysia marginata]|uniref:Tyrosine protein kinase like otk like n=1 Tax=Elysia marginata TaxID=1093978 RepID=A0AAV4JVW8_9GAST|nr:tyrosine protein kinase like otk like [Elysia marginata]
MAVSQDMFYFNVKPENTDAVEGSDVKLYCDVSDRRHIAFQWTQKGKLLQNTSRKYQEDSNLRILRVVREEDEGPFRCIATNVTTEFALETQEAKLNILCE